MEMQAKVNVSARVKNRDEGTVTIEIKIPLLRSMLSGEEVIQQGLNAAGMLASQELLKNFDTDGSPIEMGSIRLTSKGQVLKEYHTPYGLVDVERHVYQTSVGGSTFCPLDKDARIVGSATPKLAKMISHKYSRNSVDEVKTDLESNHSRAISREYIQSIAEIVGTIAIAKEESWSYSVPPITSPITAISIGLDGTTMLMREEGYRQAMVGTIALYDKKGERQHSIYVGATPEYGKEKFYKRLEKEIEHIKRLYPKAKYVGIADGAKDNWTFLDKRTSLQITDFYHASEYVAGISEAIFTKKQEAERQEWLQNHCHNLKHDIGAAKVQLLEFQQIKRGIRNPSDENMKKIDAAISYFKNQGSRMAYAEFRSKNLPIGSGITEAACKTIIKQRFCRSGMKWKDKGAAIVLSLRCLDKSQHWNQFWDKINQYGIPIAA
jgi:hypothetical protein